MLWHFFFLKNIPFLSFPRCSNFCRHVWFQRWRVRTGVEDIFPLGVSLSKRNINMADTEKSVKIEEGDPQSVQDLTGFVPFDVKHVRLLFNFKPGLYELFFLLTNGSLAVVLIALILVLPTALGDSFLFRSLNRRFIWDLNDKVLVVFSSFFFVSFYQQVQTLLQQMVSNKNITSSLVYLFCLLFLFIRAKVSILIYLQQDKFQQMSDQIITRNIL